MEVKNFIEKAKEDIANAVGRDQLLIKTVHSVNEVRKAANRLSMNLKERLGLYMPASVRDGDLVKLALKPKKEEMGMEMSKSDLESIKKLAKILESVLKLEEEQLEYLSLLMVEVAPKVEKVAGAFVGAQLMDLAGGLKSLAEMPSSRIQVLGAEKALFRHLTTDAKPPKFGVIFAHESISKAENKGKASRQLAAKISIAARVDYFSPLEKL
jgi:nucleolar protein 56